MNELRYSNRKKSIISKIIESDILRRMKSNDDVSESYVKSEFMKIVKSEILKCEYSGIDASQLGYVDDLLCQT